MGVGGGSWYLDVLMMARSGGVGGGSVGGDADGGGNGAAVGGGGIDFGGGIGGAGVGGVMTEMGSNLYSAFTRDPHIVLNVLYLNYPSLILIPTSSREVLLPYQTHSWRRKLRLQEVTLLALDHRW